MSLRSKIALAMITSAIAGLAIAQSPGAGGAAAVASEPGRASAVRTIALSAQVVAIDRTSRTLTLKGRGGEAVDVVASDEVKNFDRIKIGDAVNVRYVESLTLELKKGAKAKGNLSVHEGAVASKPGDAPAVAGAREVTALATVVAVDPKKSTITLKGPGGNVFKLPVQNRAQFNVVKKGDKVLVTYTEALALSVEPANAKSK